jgi:hypothetical protein
LATPVFGCVMSMNLFELICKFVHFNNHESKDTYLSPPKLFKICPVMSYLIRKFQNVCILDQNIAIDESLTVWIGRLSFKQYIPLKSSELNLKELCESSSCNLWAFIIYTGRQQILVNTDIKGEK